MISTVALYHFGRGKERGGEKKRTVVGGVFFAGNHGLGVEEGSVGTGTDLVDHIRLQVDLDTSAVLLQDWAG